MYKSINLKYPPDHGCDYCGKYEAPRFSKYRYKLTWHGPLEHWLCQECLRRILEQERIHANKEYYLRLWNTTAKETFSIPFKLSSAINLGSGLNQF